MSISKVPVTVTIMDKEYKISCPEGEHESLLISARHVSDTMKKIREGGKALGAERVAVMAAINIAHELMIIKKQGSNDPNISNHIDAIQTSIDSLLNTYR